MHSIKRQARKEAWYGESYNPFRKTVRVSRANSWSGDVESHGQVRLHEHAVSEEVLPITASNKSQITGHARGENSSEPHVEIEAPNLPERTHEPEIEKVDVKVDADMEANKRGNFVWILRDYSEEELSWDPFGGLSESIAEQPVYPSSYKTDFGLYAHAAEQHHRGKSTAEYISPSSYTFFGINDLLSQEKCVIIHDIEHTKTYAKHDSS